VVYKRIGFYSNFETYEPTLMATGAVKETAVTETTETVKVFRRYDDMGCLEEVTLHRCEDTGAQTAVASDGLMLYYDGVSFTGHHVYVSDALRVHNDTDVDDGGTNDTDTSIIQAAQGSYSEDLEDFLAKEAKEQAEYDEPAQEHGVEQAAQEQAAVEQAVHAAQAVHIAPVVQDQARKNQNQQRAGPRGPARRV
jgi:hypothetical protein